ncbi:MAG: TVP38/TMEM64 family protein [Alphaproteobacteria bacterium]|nr:TVP38/TMEM64 family protein [Alphaproteobacteria bacterium]MBV8335562.1 TVP38/TMEM64 family protein [Alphaproteobacteria bacterium]
MPEGVPIGNGSRLRRLVPFALLVAAGIAFLLAGGSHYLTFTALAENRDWLSGLVQRWGIVAALLYVALYAVLVALSVPGGAVLTIAGGFLFGTWAGALCAICGATAGATGVFLAARAGLGAITRRGGPLVGKLEAGFRADAFNYLLVLRLVPLFPFWLVNLVPALMGVKLRIYVLATFLGIMPGSFVYAGIGNGLGNIVEEPDSHLLLRPAVFLPIAGLAMLALVPVAYKYWRGKRPA